MADSGKGPVLTASVRGIVTDQSGPHIIDGGSEVIILCYEVLDGHVSHHKFVQLLHKPLALLPKQLLAGHH